MDDPTRTRSRVGMDPLAASPFGLLDAHGSLRLVTDVVNEDDALCLALACRPLRDAVSTPSLHRTTVDATTKGSARRCPQLWARFELIHAGLDCQVPNPAPPPLAFVTVGRY